MAVIQWAPTGRAAPIQSCLQFTVQHGFRFRILIAAHPFLLEFPIPVEVFSVAWFAAESELVDRMIVQVCSAMALPGERALAVGASG